MARDSQIVRAKENLKLSHGGSSYRFGQLTADIQVNVKKI